jgi:hypothetical protein
MNITKYLYASYGKYITRFRAIPSDLDILRPVERRVILGTKEIADSKFTKSSKVVGHVMGSYHPHGDSSIYGTIVRYVINGVIDGQGGFYTPGLKDSQPSAMRYTEVKLNKTISELIDLYKFAPTARLELEEEPLYFPTPLPIGLIGKEINQGIAFHKTTLPNYKLSDLRDRLLFLLGKETKEPIIAPNLEGCDCISDISELISLLRTGKANLTFRSKVNSKSDGVHILGCPVSFNSLIKYAKNKNKQIIDLSTDTMDIFVKDTLHNILPAITGSVAFVCNVVNQDGIVYTKSIDDMLIDGFNLYMKALQAKFESELAILQNKVEELNVLARVKPIVKDTVNINDVISKLPDIPKELIVKACSSHSVTNLINIVTDTSKLEEQIRVLQNKISHVEKEAITILRGIKA